MLVISPTVVVLPRKTKADRKIALNLNTYRNLHFQVNNQVKELYCDALQCSLRGLTLKVPITLHYTYFKASNRKSDRSNVLSIVEKFFLDALVHYGCIPDDDDSNITSSHYYSGGVSKLNPRVEITINEQHPTKT
jgi:hypothetical protein